MISIPRVRAASATARGKVPFPAMRPSLFTFAANDSTGGTVHKLNQAPNFRDIAVLLDNLLYCILPQEFGVEKCAKRPLQCGDSLGGKLAPLQQLLVNRD